MLFAGHLQRKSFQKEPRNAKVFTFAVLGGNGLITEKLYSEPESEMDKIQLFSYFFVCLFALLPSAQDLKAVIFCRLRLGPRHFPSASAVPNSCYDPNRLYPRTNHDVVRKRMDVA